MAFSFGQRKAWEQPSRLHWAIRVGTWVCLAMSPLYGHAQSLVALTERAQAHDPAWQSTRAQLDAAIYQGERAKAGLLPQLGLQAGSQYSDSRVRGNFPTTQLQGRQDSAGLSARQPLYAPADVAAYRQGQRNAEIAQAQLDAASQALLVRAAQAYFQLLAAQDTLALVTAQKAAVAEQLAYAQRNFEIGTATVTDAREAQARFDLVRAQEIAAENELRVQQAALDQITGLSDARPWPLAQSLRPDALDDIQDLSTWLELARNHSPLIRQAQLGVHMAQLETEKAYAGHKPTVDLQASYGLQRNPDGSSTIPARHDATVGSIGVVINIPLFAGFAVQNRVKETLALQRKQDADLQDASQQVAQAVRTAFYGLQSAQGQVQALEAAVVSSQSALEANLLGYEVGVRINMDVLNAQSQLFQAQKDLAYARYQMLLAGLQLRQASGTLALQHIHATNQWLQPPAL